MDKKKIAKLQIYYLVAVIFSVGFTFSSVMWDTDIAKNTEELTHMRFGWPFGFLEENLSLSEKKITIFPFETNFVIGNGYDTQEKIMYGVLFLDLVINFVLSLVFLTILKKFHGFYFKKVLTTSIILILFSLLTWYTLQYFSPKKIFIIHFL